MTHILVRTPQNEQFTLKKKSSEVNLSFYFYCIKNIPADVTPASAQAHFDGVIVFTSHPPEGAGGFQCLWHRDIYRKDNVVVSNVWQHTLSHRGH